MRLLLVTLCLLLAVVACGAAVDSSPSLPTERPADSAPGSGVPTPEGSTAVPPTPVPGGQTVDPEPVATRIPTTQTEWGEILDALPDSFPIYPGAGIVELPGGPVSASFDAPADARDVAAWYLEALSDRGYAVELGAPLENGSRTLDARSDLPECRIRMTFTTEGGSAIMTVLYAAACAGLGG